MVFGFAIVSKDARALRDDPSLARILVLDRDSHSFKRSGTILPIPPFGVASGCSGCLEVRVGNRVEFAALIFDALSLCAKHVDRRERALSKLLKLLVGGKPSNVFAV